MNPFCVKDESLTSRTHVVVPSKGEVTAVASNIIRHRQGLLESTRIDDGHKDVDTCRKPNARAHSYPICLHKHFNKEKAHGRESEVERLHWGRSSSTRAIFGRIPLQPRSRRRTSGGPSSISVKKSRKGSGAGEAHQRGSNAFERKQQRDSKWNLGSGALTDRPPLQPFSRHEIREARCPSTQEHHKNPSLEEPRPVDSIRSLQQCGASLSSDYRSSFDMAPSQALAHRRAIVGPSSVSALNESLNDAVKMKNRATSTLFETRLKSRRLSGTPQTPQTLQRPSVFRFARSPGLSPGYNRLVDREALSPRYNRLAGREALLLEAI
jgi:hypothetical protein